MYPNNFRAAGDPRPYWSACFVLYFVQITFILYLYSIVLFILFYIFKELKKSFQGTRVYFGEEFSYVMDAKSMGNLGRYLNVSSMICRYSLVVVFGFQFVYH